MAHILTRLHLAQFSWKTSVEEIMILAAGTALVLVLLLILFFERRRLNRLKEELRRAAHALKTVRPGNPLEDSLKSVLILLAEFIEAPYFAFYVRENRGNNFSLKAVIRPAEDFRKVAPSYSGLALPDKEVYLPPVTLMSDDLPSEPGVIKSGEVPLFVACLNNGRTAIRIGPVRTVKKSVQREIQKLLSLLDEQVQDLLDIDDVRTRSLVALTAEKAVKNIASLFADPAALFELVIPMYASHLHLLGGFLIERAQGTYRCIATMGQAESIEDFVRHDVDSMELLSSWVTDRESFVIHARDEQFYLLPMYLSTLGTSSVAVLRTGENTAYCLLLGHGPADFSDQTSGVDSLDALVRQLSSMMRIHSGDSGMNQGYVQVLKRLSALLENREPNTVGYSEMVQRYSLAIGLELGLSDSEMHDLALAALLSNIGVLGLSMDLLFKEGKYSEDEYEIMKLHSQVGASMIHIATGNRRAANYVMYHHERMDGQGYPEGVRGDQIPIGARIIAVVQVFLAKINARGARAPLAFDESIKLLKSAAGSQLDAHVVDAFINWFERKRSSLRASGRSLGTCSDMCSVPADICKMCPVYRDAYQKNCWEYDSNLCRAHGRECQTCFVRSEFLSRVGSLDAGKGRVSVFHENRLS